MRPIFNFSSRENQLFECWICSKKQISFSIHQQQKTSLYTCNESALLFLGLTVGQDSDHRAIFVSAYS